MGEYRIARDVAPAVVDRLEVVQVEHQHTAPMAARSARVNQAQARLDQGTAVEQAGEPIGACQLAQIGEWFGQHQGEPGTRAGTRTGCRTGNSR